MSVCVWAIQGIGFNVNDLNFDFNAIGGKFKTDYKKYLLGDDLFTPPPELLGEEEVEMTEELLTELGEEMFDYLLCSNKHQDLFGENILLAYTNDGGDNGYLYCPAMMPWEITEEYKTLEEKELKDILCKLVKPFVNESYDELRDMIDDINTYGQS